MPTLTIRNLDTEVRDQIRVHAAKHGRSMEAEVREILSTYVRQQQLSPKQLADRIHKRFATIGGVEKLELPERQLIEKPISLSE